MIHDRIDFYNTAIEQADYRLIEVGRDYGSFTVLGFAFLSLVTSMVLPLLTDPLVDSTSWRGTVKLPAMPRPSISRVWMLSHILLAACMFLTFFAWTATFAGGLLACTGLSWGIASW